MFKVFQVLLLIIVSTGLLKASSEDTKSICVQMKKSVDEFTSWKLKRKVISSKSCYFDWQTSAEENVSLSLHYLKTEEQSKKKLEEIVNFLSKGWEEGAEFLKFEKYDSTGIWNEGYFYKGNIKNSSSIVVRKQKFVIEIFTPNPEMAISLEGILRKLKFMK